MTGQCKDCGYICELGEMLERYGCPACRATRVAKAFAPVDALRTAMGILHTNVDWQSAEWKDVKARADAAMNQDGTWQGVEEPEQTEDTPRGLRMPKGDAAQCYELRRMFRL